MVEFRVLGPVEVWSAGRRFQLHTTKQRALLVALVADAGIAVGVDTLIDRVWDAAPPQQARNALYAQVSRLRQVLSQVVDAAGDPVILARRSGGYALEVDPETVDMHRMRRLVDRARAGGGTDEQRAALLREAIQLWHGEPLTGLPGRWAAQTRHALHQQRLDALGQWTQAELCLGNAHTVVGPLTELVGEHPLAEPLVAAAMRALYLAGRRADALDCYANVRRRLAEELGLDPGAELQRLHQAILRDEVDAPEPVPAAVPRARPPATLPLDVYGFTGRTAELSQLDELLADSAAQPTAVVISAIVGTAGIGKTALAVHWAHRVAGLFPDGQLYVNLRGFDPGGAALSWQDAVRIFLDALGVPPHRIPADPEAQTGLYRSLLTGRRVLVVLDNARHAEQVRPLLPGAPGCLAIVTSRRQLTGLVVAEGARPITLDLLTAAESRNLLSRRLGARRVAAEPDATDDIIATCARLPLALAVAAGRAAARPDLPLAELANRIHAASARLDAFGGDDAATDVRAVFSWSYQELGPDAARMFRLLSLSPAPDIGRAAVASLAGIPPVRAEPVLAELCRAHLVTESVSGRYALHDLLREYAGELAAGVETATDRHEALLRLLDHYLHTAHAAAQRLVPHRHPIGVAAPRPGVTVEPVADYAQALAWFTAEHRALLAAHGTGTDAHVWQLAWTLATYLDRRGRWAELATTHTSALAATRRLADPAGEAVISRYLARAYVRLGRYADAHAHYRRALKLYARLDDRAGQAHTHLDLGWVFEREHRYREALDQAQRALKLYRVVGDAGWQGRALNAAGWYHALLGNDRKALRCCEDALRLLLDVDDRNGQAATWDSLGYVYHQLGDHAAAATHYERALALRRELGDRYNEAETLTHLGDTHRSAGDRVRASAAWAAALAIFEQLDHPDADLVRARLAEPGDGRPTPPPLFATARR